MAAERRRHHATVDSSPRAQERGSPGAHRPRVPRAPRSRTKGGCLTCRTRSKGCSDKMKAGVCPAGPCEECERLHIECLGYEPRHPPWLKKKKDDLIHDIKEFTKGLKEEDDFLQFDNYYKDTDWRPHFGTKDSMPPSDEMDDAEGLSIEGGTTSEEFSSISPVIPQAGGRPLPTPSASESGEPIFSPLSPHPHLPCQTFPMALPSFAVHPNVSSVGYPSYTSGPGSVCWAPTDSVHGHLIDHIIGEGPWPLDPPVASYPA